MVTVTRGTVGKTYYENFSYPNYITLWSAITGTWTNTSDMLKGVATVATRQTAKYTGISPPADMVLEVVLKYHIANAIANLIFRAADQSADSNDRIWLRLDGRASGSGGGLHLFEDVGGVETQVGTYSFSPVQDTLYYVKLVISGTTIYGYADTDGYGHTLRWTATVSKATAGYLLAQVEYFVSAEAWFDTLKIYENETIFVNGLAENNFVELIGSSDTVLASAYANASGEATIDFSSLSTRPPYHSLKIWATDAKASLLYQPTVGVSWFNDLWGGDHFAYGAGTDPDGHTSIAFSPLTWTEVLATQTHVSIAPDGTSYVEVLSAWTNERILEQDCTDIERCTPVYDDQFGVLDNCLYKIEGVTKDSSGSPLGSCTVILMKTDPMGVNGKSIMQMKVSDASTGAYKFYVRDPDTAYFVVAFKAGPPNVFGRTDRDIKAVAI